MNETETMKVAQEVARHLMIISADLLDGEFISPHDLAEVLRSHSNRLFADISKEAQPTQSNSDPHSNSDAERLRRYHTVRYTGIEFKRHFSPKFVRLVGSFVSPTGDRNSNHVYELLVKESAKHPGRWVAKGTNDGRELFTLTSSSKWKAERLGFGALRSWLQRALRRTIDSNRAKGLG